MGEKTVNETKPNKLQWFLFAGVIPILFVVTILLLISTFTGFNLFEAAKSHIPGFSQTDPAKTDTSKQVVGLQATIEDQKKEISSLTKLLDDKDKTADELKQQIERLQAQLDQNEQPVEGEDQPAPDSKEKELAKVYQSMSSKNAAAIVEKLDTNTALAILESVNTESRAAILEKLQPEKAAELTTLLRGQ